MKQIWISAFIDDELKLAEKVGFVEAIHADRAYKAETVDLLRQERLLRGRPTEQTPPISLPETCRPPSPRSRSQSRSQPWLRSVLLGLGAAAALFILWIKLAPQHQVAAPAAAKSHRFVIYRPDVTRAEISGSFTDWRPVSMQRLGNSGYWEVRLELTGGEHRFAYILDGNERITDPTVPIREKDDFGGENSILTVSL
jgi:hypothetical protein